MGETQAMAAALGAALCWAVAPVLFSFGGRTVDGATINRLRLVPACLLLACAQWALEGVPALDRLSAVDLAWLALSGVCGLALGDTCMLKGLLLIGPRLVTLVMTLVPLLTAIPAWLLFGERLSFGEIAGGAVCMSGVALVVSARRGAGLPHAAADYRKGLLLALGGAVGQALALMTAKQGLSGDLPVITAVLVRMTAGMLSIWLVQGIGSHARALRALNRKALGFILAGAAVGPFLGVWLSILAVSGGRVGPAATLMATTPILILPIAHFAMGERITARAVLGSLTAFAGIVCMMEGRA